ncbi:spindle and kinetochore-associated protein 3 isoform X6 [Pyrgilauda ruficollis]|uniref:spindle and kinetochore-associated protein 3 isoform X6 n=1 Tax=Pyrgilauda ruficollis TaxID=221976 RepID=UPI001B8717AF|nr:spindle and kinetochore-associated protein 3 isoform X6 [Pyrgilauda ruficollis]
MRGSTAAPVPSSAPGLTHREAPAAAAAPAEEPRWRGARLSREAAAGGARPRQWGSRGRQFEAPQRRAARPGFAEGRPGPGPAPLRSASLPPLGAMDVTGVFFGKLRELALTVEKEVKQLERAMRREDADYEDESPLAVLNDLHGEIKAQKEDVSASLGKICSEKKAVQEFMKASEILMQRNAADLGKIGELFQKYGYKPNVKDSTEEEDKANSESAMSVQKNSDEEKANDVPHPSASAEKPPLPKDPLRNPQLSDFGLSQYAFSRPWSALKAQHAAGASQLRAKSETPLGLRTPRALPKTPKCKLKMDDYECVTPKLEHFGISEHTMCMNEDYTMSLIHKTSQTIKKLVKRGDNNGGNLPEMTVKEIMVTPASKSSKRAKNAAADWMASPMVFVFCTPDVKDSSKTNNTVLSRSPETKELPLPSHAATPQCPDFQTGWLKAEAKQQVTPGEKLESVTKNDAKDMPRKEERIPFAASSDEYLKHTGDPSPPKLEDYDHLLNTPPPPEITRIPDNVLKMLSQYNHKVDSSKAKEMETKAGNTTRFESGSTDYSNKENRGYHGVFKTNI